MSEERPFGKFDKKPICDPWDFKKDCNLCKEIQVGNEITLGTFGGFVICGCVTDIDCHCAILRLATGAQVLRPGDCTILCTDRVISICCDNIEWFY